MDRSRCFVALAVAAAQAAMLPPSCLAGDDHKAGKHRHLSLNPFKAKLPPSSECPESLVNVGNRLDVIAEGIRDDGLVVLKHPDVYSQARMTKYRRDFEEQMAKDLDQFAVILSARVARLDQSALDIQAALAAAGMAQAADQGAETIVATTPTTAAPPVAPALGLPGSDPRFFRSDVPLGGKDYNIGLEPTVVLQEKQRYLDALNGIRRVNIGDDIADSAGYGLYLVRLPISITPGEKTKKGHGAQISLTVHPEFGEDFLASTFRNLVINDLIDQLTPVLFEFNRLRSAVEEFERQKIDFSSKIFSLNIKISSEHRKLAEELAKDGTKDAIAGFIRGGQTLEHLASKATDEERASALARFNFLLGSYVGVVEALFPDPGSKQLIDLVKSLRSKLARYLHLEPNIEGDDLGTFPGEFDPLVGELIDLLAKRFAEVSGNPTVLAEFMREFLQRGLPPQADLLRKALKVDLAEFAKAQAQLADAQNKLKGVESRLQNIAGTLSRPASRNIQRLYPIAPGEFNRFFLEANLRALADDLRRSTAMLLPRATDYQAYLRQQLSVAYDLMSTPIAGEPPALAQGPMFVKEDNAYLGASGFIEQVQQAIRRRDFAAMEAGLYPHLVRALLPGNLPINGQLPPGAVVQAPNQSTAALSALCWAVAVDAAMLDEALHRESANVLADNGLPCPDPAVVKFYQPLIRTPGLYEDYKTAHAAFVAYVGHRWPIITFAIDPVVDQQNILDEYSMRRDLQLALAFAFASGQVSFQQLTTFRRKLETDAETIALNQTASSFAHGNDTFGWRFYPRYQNPPAEGNLRAVVNTLVYGGPPPRYNLRNREIEPGLRELTAIIIMPSFLRNIRMDSASNWFRLDEPDDLKVTTGRMLEEGRYIHQLRSEMKALDTHLYRPEDVRVLSSKIQQVAAMLPMQSQRVLMPFDNTANGFQLFTEGASAQVPELTGFEGADRVRGGQATSLLLFGKGISIHETRVVAGGRALDPAKSGEAEILSREIVRVTLPKDVQPSTTVEGLPYVEVYLATSEGISNRLLVPFEGTPGKEDDKTEKAFPPYSQITVVETGTVTERVFNTDKDGKPIPQPAPPAAEVKKEEKPPADPEPKPEPKPETEVVPPKGVTAPSTAAPPKAETEPGEPVPLDAPRIIPPPPPAAEGAIDGGGMPSARAGQQAQGPGQLGLDRREASAPRRHVPILLPPQASR